MHQRVASMERVRSAELIELRNVFSAPYMKEQDADKMAKEMRSRATPWIAPQDRPMKQTAVNLPSPEEIAARLGVKLHE